MARDLADHRKSSVCNIRRINASDTYPLRSAILRPGQDFSACRWPGDSDDSTRHLGAYEQQVLIGVLSLYKTLHRQCDFPRSYQLRGMATLASVRGKGYAKILVSFAERQVLDDGGECIWANARVSALGFYQKLNYAVVGVPFNIESIGSHQLIAKMLK